MEKKNAILGGMALALVLTLIACPFIAAALALTEKPGTSKSEPWKADTYAALASAVSAAALVFVGIYTVRSAEKVAERQKLFLEKMENQKTRPYCDFVIVLATSTTKPIGVYIINYGHGPALHLHWTFKVKGVAIAQTGRKGIEKVADVYSLNAGWLEIFFPNVIAAQSEIPLFRLRDANKDHPEFLGAAREKAIKRLIQMIGEMDIEVSFEPIMGESDTQKLHHPNE